jgi:hypothetical protein
VGERGGIVVPGTRLCVPLELPAVRRVVACPAIVADGAFAPQ